MRAIKFRVWDKKSSKLIAPGKDGVLTFEVYTDEEGLNSLSWEVQKPSWRETNGLDPDECELSQFTGLLDAKQREIYDGDIVQSCETKNLYLVEWSGDLPGWSPFLWELANEYGGILTGRKVTVIGNKWENPQLAEAVDE